MARTTSKAKPPPQPPSSSDPLLTQENFEKELKSLALSARSETWSKYALEQAWILTQSGVLLTLAAVYSNISLLSLSPVYGGIPSSILHSKGVITACFLGWSSNLFLRRRLPLKPQYLLPLLAAYIPVMQFFLFKISGALSAVYGPIVTEACTYLPLLLLSVSCAANVLENLEMSPGRLQWLADSMPGILSFAFFKTMESVSNERIQAGIGATFIQTRLGLQILLAGLYALFAPSKLLLYAIPALLHTALFNTHVQLPYTTSLLNSTLAQANWTLIDRQESLTGYISIIENKDPGYRVMRCDHSLLGGEWLRKPERNGLAEPIYGVFVMLEAVRLVEVAEPVPDSEATAFVVGLGIGTTPAALITHGIATTIVEIDPVVHSFATKYFALPSNHKAIITDAVSVASDLAQTSEKFDYVVHDVFTGGAEPVDLFTYEFLSDLKSLLKPGGVIAINYAGDLLLPSARIILRTIHTIFPRCRIFRESERPSASTIKKQGQDFINMVVFCTNGPSFPKAKNGKGKGGKDGAITFRKPVVGDFLGSKAREAFLLPVHEVDYMKFVDGGGNGRKEVKSGGVEGEGMLFKNGTEQFRGWQQTSALGHWSVMRTVVPGWVWENW